MAGSQTQAMIKVADRGSIWTPTGGKSTPPISVAPFPFRSRGRHSSAVASGAAVQELAGAGLGSERGIRRHDLGVWLPRCVREMNIFVGECSGVRPCFVSSNRGVRLEIISESSPPHFGYARD